MLLDTRCLLLPVVGVRQCGIKFQLMSLCVPSMERLCVACVNAACYMLPQWNSGFINPIEEGDPTNDWLPASSTDYEQNKYENRRRQRPQHEIGREFSR
ncbi:hypothetical protein Zmor_018844 [Zophobas morio]|uniref:Uncharacterized protein n=1 Tax=Zophobas morio TaxID=2755281 RepID=A0AA38ID18_9CUCU|nr:hypothetical protein Zmor_018844 [Zophobas morio]